MFNIQHDLDAMIIALLGVVSLIWLGRNIFMAFKELIKDQVTSQKVRAFTI
jgi:hypothetical protein